MREKVILRADGNATIGLGHIFRLLALHDMISSQFDVMFAVQQPEDNLFNTIRQKITAVTNLPAVSANDPSFENELLPFITGNEIVVLDGYHFATAYQSSLKRRGCKVVCIDDIYTFPFSCDIVINHGSAEAEKHYKVAPYTKVMCGWKYLLLRKEFFEAALRKRNPESKESVFICFGGADSQNNTLKTLEACHLSGCFSSIYVVTGSAFSHSSSLQKYIEHLPGIQWESNVPAARIVHLLQRSFMVVCPASSVALEVCAVKAGLITGITVENQSTIHREIIRLNCGVSIGDFNTISAVELAAFIKERMKGDTMEKLMLNQSRKIDGRSPERIRQLFIELVA